MGACKWAILVTFEHLVALVTGRGALMAACCFAEVRGAGCGLKEIARAGVEGNGTGVEGNGTGVEGNGTGAVGIIWGCMDAKWYLKVM
jgi:hypothetical protein